MVEKKKKEKAMITSGKRKDAIARAIVKEGKGRIKVNSVPLELWTSELMRMKVQEAVVLAEDVAPRADINVEVRGGGTTGQSDAVRMAIARAFVAFSKDKKLKERYIQYDRNMLVYDPRRNEPHHAGGASRRGSRRHKQRSKR
jgi:small subunit ribosomal protein S9